MLLKSTSVFVLATAAASASTMYTVTQIGGLRDQGNALSQNGTVGGFNLNNPSEGFIATSSSFNYIGRASGQATIVYGINDSGVAAAAHTNSTRAAYWDGLAWVDLHAAVGTTNSQGRDINNAGQILGMGGTQAWIRETDGTINFISTINFPYQINASGQIVGRDTANKAAFRNPDGTVNTMGLPGTSGQAYAISDAGHVVGFYVSGTSGTPFLYTPGSGYVNVAGLGSDPFIDLRGVNSSGDAVGISNGRAAVVTGGVTLDLNTLIFPVPNLFLSHALRINDAGQILALGRFTLAPSTDTYTFLLTPDTGSGEVPEPSSYALLGAGLTALGWTRRRV